MNLSNVLDISTQIRDLCGDDIADMVYASGQSHRRPISSVDNLNNALKISFYKIFFQEFVDDDVLEALEIEEFIGGILSGLYLTNTQQVLVERLDRIFEEPLDLAIKYYFNKFYDMSISTEFEDTMRDTFQEMKNEAAEINGINRERS